MNRPLIALILLLSAACSRAPKAEQQAESTGSAPMPASQTAPADSFNALGDTLTGTGDAPGEPDPSWFEPSVMGKGIISISDTADQFKTRFRFYDNKGRPLAYIQVNDSATLTVTGGKTYRDIDSTHPWEPRFFDPEPHYFKIYFDVLGTTDGYYKVLLNRKTGLTGYIKRDDRNFRFQTIEEFVRERAEAGVEFHLARNPLRKQPANDAATVSAASGNAFSWRGAKKLSIRGDWMQVRLNDTGESGWIRWRKGSEFLIGLIYRC